MNNESEDIQGEARNHNCWE